MFLSWDGGRRLQEAISQNRERTDEHKADQNPAEDGLAENPMFMFNISASYNLIASFLLNDS